MPNLHVVVLGAVVMVTTLTLLLGCAQRRGDPVEQTVNPFPAVADVREIRATVTLEHPTEASPLWVPHCVSVPPEHWEALLNAMLPAETDANPSGWEIVGWLEIATDDELFKVMFGGSETAFFKIGDEYYRGGNSEQLASEIRTAYIEVTIKAVRVRVPPSRPKEIEVRSYGNDCDRGTSAYPDQRPNDHR